MNFIETRPVTAASKSLSVEGKEIAERGSRIITTDLKPVRSCGLSPIYDILPTLFHEVIHQKINLRTASHSLTKSPLHRKVT